MSKKSFLLRLTVFCVLLTHFLCLLSGCGINTKTWPHISFSFSADDVLEITVFYERNANKYLDYLKEEIVINKKDSIESIINTIEAYPYKEEKEKSVNEEDFSSMISVEFIYSDCLEEKTENIKFYEYGISNSKVILNDSTIHYLPGDISEIYNTAKEKK